MTPIRIFSGSLFIALFFCSLAPAAPCSLSFTYENERLQWEISKVEVNKLWVYVGKEGAEPQLDVSTTTLLSEGDYQLIFKGGALTGWARYVQPTTQSLEKVEFQSGHMRPLGDYDLNACFERCARRFAGNNRVCKSVCRQTSLRWTEYQAAYFEADLDVFAESRFAAKAMILKSCLSSERPVEIW